MIIKLLWPEICPFCGKIYQKGICPACKEKIKQLKVVQPVCMKCGKPVLRMEQEYCTDCISSKHYFDRAELSGFTKNLSVILSINLNIIIKECLGNVMQKK